ncbi:response regulator [Paenibacillus hemerocallicola]|uniref:Response regulator n=1 Tax=Paenibacillus hemerocallicola TaxID=1172614 RepID=A0A5C4THU4_9BACL|nr:HD domain-containing phosphohydrolase [Paenibacillus hemerocallicola]TNJ67989.1 response regulator [Paenibacillus hemerocallicola]
MEDAWIRGAKFLIVDDQEYNVSLLERILIRAGFENWRSTTDPLLIDSLYDESAPDIVLLDLHMPEMDGFTALKLLRSKIPEQQYLPILVLTADVSSEAKQKALLGGANDFLTKPFDKSEVVLRITNLLKTRYLHLQLQNHNAQLEDRVKERTSELEKAKFEILELLGRTSEYRDDVTEQHTQRVGQLSGMIARELGLPASEAELIRLASPLHDIGKIGIPDRILLKPGRFTEEEFEEMKTHAGIGASILDGSLFPVLQVAKVIALTHHERWDGRGYPSGLKGSDIPLAGRIVAIADFYDALTHQRPYKQAWTKEETVEEIRKQRGAHFDPEIVDAFLKIIER